MNLDLWRRRKPDALTTAERTRLATADDTIARLTEVLQQQKAKMADARRLYENQHNRLTEQIRLRVEAEARCLDYARRLDECQTASPPVATQRPEMCDTLAECSGNRAAASRVTRVVEEATA